MGGHVMTEEEVKKHVRGYYIVFGTLLALTVVTVAISYLHLPLWAAVVLALLVASFKGSLVCLYFMHLISEHLFWAEENNEDVLYSLSAQYNTTQALQTLIVYRYGTGDKEPSSCQLYGSIGERFYIGKGHEFPYVFLYKTSPAWGGGTALSFYRLPVNQTKFPSGTNLDKCKPEALLDQPLWVPGEVEAAYHLPKQNGILGHLSSFAVKTTDAIDNLLWVYRRNELEAPQCSAFDFGGRDHFVLNTSQSIVTTWSREEGIKLVLPQEGAEARIFNGLEIEGLEERDFLLANNGRLFVAGQTPSGKKELFLTDLKK